MTFPKTIQIGVLLITLTTLGGCAPKERVLGNLYEGVQMQNRQAAPPNGEAQAPTPGYDEYLRQRREVVQEAGPNKATP
jgi:hypothetical protein